MRLATGREIYGYDGKSFPPGRDTGPAPECRVEISPKTPAKVDHFLHVLTATDSGATAVPIAKCEVADGEIHVSIGPARVTFERDEVAAEVTFSGEPR